MAVVHVVGMDATQHLLDTDGPVVVDTGLLGTFQIVVVAVLHPAQSRLVVVEADGADGACGVTRLTGLGAGRILAQQTAAGLFIDIHLTNSY